MIHLPLSAFRFSSPVLAQINPSLLIAGALIAYCLVMAANPVRRSFGDGFRAIGRYRALWVTIGCLGFCHALFQLALRIYFHNVLPPADRPPFLWVRDAWRDPQLWLHGSPQSLWHLPMAEFRLVLNESILPCIGKPLRGIQQHHYHLPTLRSGGPALSRQLARAPWDLLRSFTETLWSMERCGAFTCRPLRNRGPRQAVYLRGAAFAQGAGCGN